MQRLTIEQRVKVVEAYYENGRSNENTFRALREFFGQHNRPTESAIGKIVCKFKQIGSLADVWFQQDGATFHTVNATMALLNEKFPGRIISRNSEVNLPPRSCDLTPLDFFLWGYLKSKVYANKPTTVQQLKDEIRRHIGEIAANYTETSLKTLTIEWRCAVEVLAGICQESDDMIQ